MSINDRPLKTGSKVRAAIYTASDEPVCIVDSMGELNEDAEVSRRLVACWNACIGLSTRSLEAMPGGFYGALQAEVRRQRPAIGGYQPEPGPEPSAPPPRKP